MRGTIQYPSTRRAINLIAFLLLIPVAAFSQVKITSGNYGVGLTIAFDKGSNLISGYYENAAGWDEATKSPQFTCSFYFQGSLKENKFEIKSVSPRYVEDGTIAGTVEAAADNQVKLQLTQDPGGCWNVQQLVESPAEFKLEAAKTWIQVRYVTADKAYFHLEEREETKQKAYILKGDIVYVEKTNAKWAYCSFIGKKVTKGWIKTSELNAL